MQSVNIVAIEGFHNVTISCTSAPPPPGNVVWAREMPSDTSLLSTFVVRTMEFCKCEGLVVFTSSEEENQLAICLREALENAVQHGNGNNFSKMVSLKFFTGHESWGFVIRDQGAGFDPSSIVQPTSDEGLLRESGRGVGLMSHYMDSVEYFENGRVVFLTKHR